MTSLGRRLLQSGSGIAAAQALTLGLTLARNVVLARMLGPEQFGVAATYAVVMAFIEASFEFSSDKYIVQAPDGHRPEVVGAAHTFSLARGLVAGLVLFLLAHPIAELFHVPEYAWAYQALAISPVIRAVLNLDFRVAQRQLLFAGEVIIMAASTTIGFVVAVVVAYFEPTHVAMLISLLTQALAMVALSFFVARAPYRLGVGRSELAALYRFGWPLVANSVIIIGALQGDRALVGAVFGPELLAVYATAAILAGAPLLMVARVVGTIMLPVLGPLRDQPQFRVRYEAFGAIIAIAAIAMNVPIALLGAYVVPLLFGAAYNPDPALVAALGAAGGVGLLRAWTNIAALSVGNSKATLHTNMVRLTGLLAAVVLTSMGGDLKTVAAALLFGESAALAFGLLRTHGTNNLPASTGLPFIAPTVIVLYATVPLSAFTAEIGWQAALVTTLCLQAATVAVLFAASSRLRLMTRSLLVEFRW